MINVKKRIAGLKLVRMNELFRHVSSWLLLIGVAVSFFAFINASDIYQNVRNAADEANEYKYKTMYSIYVSDFFDDELLVDKINQIPGNIISTGNYMYINNTEKYQEIEIVIKQDENLSYPVKIIDKDGEIYIGKKLEEECHRNNGILYLTIGDKDYRVAGILSSDSTDILNYKIIVLRDSNMISNILEQGTIIVECGSNLCDLDKSIRNFYSDYEKYAYIDYNSISSRYIEVGSETADQEFYIVISIFSIINCVVISEFWILRRKKEIIIRKLFGFTDKRLFFYIYNQIVKISTFAVALVLITEKIINELGIIDYSLSLKKAILACGFVIVSSLILTMIPIIKASSFQIEEGREMI